MRRFCDDFISTLDRFDLETLENHPHSVFGLSGDLTIIYLNPGWFEFATRNEGEPGIPERFGLGAPLDSALSGSVREYYLDVYRNLLHTGNVWHHEYECSSPEIFRKYHQVVYPLRNRCGLIVVNSLVVEKPHDLKTRAPHTPTTALYVWETGFIHQCSNCRRVQRISEPGVWDWIPSWVKHPLPNTSHTFCPICFDYYFKFGV